MAIHPKIGVVVATAVGAVSLGLAVFLLGRITASTDLTGALVGAGAALIVATGMGLALLKYLPVGRYFDGILHQDSTASDMGYVSAPTRAELVGKLGRSVSELRPVGIADIEGERVDVATEGEWLPSGTPIEVIRAEAMRVVVRAARQLNA